uniref:DUF5641 domain-containing protein n=1 Tax=Macrostomum lignano TaxID=282301 RepID=A0A1I8FG92_9PLAT
MQSQQLAFQSAYDLVKAGRPVHWPRLRWRLGLVEEIRVGRDGAVRSAVVRVSVLEFPDAGSGRSAIRSSCQQCPSISFNALTNENVSNTTLRNLGDSVLFDELMLKELEAKAAARRKPMLSNGNPIHEAKPKSRVLMETRNSEFCYRLSILVEAVAHQCSGVFGFGMSSLRLIRQYEILYYIWESFVNVCGNEYDFEFSEHSINYYDIPGAYVPDTPAPARAKPLGSFLSYMSMEKLGPQSGLHGATCLKSQRKWFKMSTALKLLDQILCRLMVLQPVKRDAADRPADAAASAAAIRRSWEVGATPRYQSTLRTHLRREDQAVGHHQLDRPHAELVHAQEHQMKSPALEGSLSTSSAKCNNLRDATCQNKVDQLLATEESDGRALWDLNNWCWNTSSSSTTRYSVSRLRLAQAPEPASSWTLQLAGSWYERLQLELDGTSPGLETMELC